MRTPFDASMELLYIPPSLSLFLKENTNPLSQRQLFLFYEVRYCLEEWNLWYLQFIQSWLMMIFSFNFYLFIFSIMYCLRGYWSPRFVCCTCFISEPKKYHLEDRSDWIFFSFKVDLLIITFSVLIISVKSQSYSVFHFSPSVTHFRFFFFCYSLESSLLF